ncbi:MAG: DUF4153 domain-containing protein [Ignavibacteria bacterium]|jgi:hypothetical protein
MKIPSLKILFEGAKETLQRFPFVIITSIIGTAFMIYIVDQPFERQDSIKHLYNVVIVCSLGISFLLSLVFICERMGTSKLVSIIVQIICIILLTVYYLTLPGEVGYKDITRYFLFMIGTHLLVSFSPFVNKGFSLERHGFWQFNQDLFLKVLITAAYSGVLYAGLSIAILSFDKLFDVNIDSKRYAQLVFFIFGVFNTWFFLSRLPKNLDELENQNFYPIGLKIFTQYILLPLVTIYLLILYLYAGKIIIQWQLPMGWVSYLVLGFSTTGIFSLLLIEPLREMEGINWIKKFSKWFYLILFPLIILLFTAILRRTGEYGITEKRYFVFVLAVWLTFIAVYFSLSKIKNIKIIPYSLCIIAFLTSFGPWGAFSLSEKSQIGRLEEILTNNKILVDGKIVKATNPISDEERQDVSSVIQFLNDRKLMNRIQPWFDVEIDTIKGGQVESVYKSKEAKITELMGIEYSLYRRNYSQDDKYLYFNLKEFNSLNIKGFDYLIRYRYNLYEKGEKIKQFQIDSTNRICFEFNDDSLLLSIKNNDVPIENIKFEKFIEYTRKIKKELVLNDLSIDGENEIIKYKIVFQNISGNREDNKNKIQSFNSEVFLKIK